MVTVSQLPVEVWMLVVAQCGRDELKALRLTSHACSTAATEYLFRELHISPNSHSFDRAHNISEHDHLRRYAKSLVYHYGVLEDAHSGFESFRHEWFSARKPGEVRNPSEITAEVIWSYNCYLEEMDGQRTFDLRIEEDELDFLVRGMPNLQSISTLLDDVKPFTELHDYIGKRVGMAAVAADDYGDGRFPKLFKVAADKSLWKVSARSIQWSDLDFIEETPGEGAGRYGMCLRKLKFLELGIYNALNAFEFENDEYKDEYRSSVDKLGIFLHEAQNLTTLKLDFDELPFESHTVQMLHISQIIFKHQWPELRELKLEALCAHEDAFVEFLDRHKASLKTLCLGDIELATDGDKLPSILTFFQSIRGSLRLQTCRITGNFTNRIDQAWYVDTEYQQQNCFRDQLEAYLCRQDQCIPAEAQKHEEHEVERFWDLGIHLELWLHRVVDDYESFCDGSWYWCPELLEDD